MSVSIIIITLAILFVAAFVKACLGFGEALLALPLLTLVIGLQMATPLIGLIGASLTTLIIAKSWRHIDFSATWQLVIAALIGIPVGVWGLKRLPEMWATTGLGMLLVLVALNNLLKPTFRPLRGAGWPYVFGFVAGVCGGAYTIAGPPVLLYGALRKWPPEQFRATLQSFFLPVTMMIILTHANAGLWTRDVLLLYVFALPVLGLSFWLGARASQRLASETFERLVYGALIVLGALLIV